jgi:hypothetical protein
VHDFYDVESVFATRKVRTTKSQQRRLEKMRRCCKTLNQRKIGNECVLIQKTKSDLKETLINTTEEKQTKLWRMICILIK